MKPTFFKKQSDWRKWLEKYHHKDTELWVGFYKTSSGKPSITWSQSVDHALCFGWIDAVRKSIDEESYVIRFTRRKPKSIWSAVNLKKVEELIRQGLMMEAGLATFNARDVKKANRYSFEQGEITLDKGQEKKFKANKTAWKFFQLQPASYKKAAIWHVIGAKQEATKLKRLASLIENSEARQRLPHLRRIVKK